MIFVRLQLVIAAEVVNYVAVLVSGVEVLSYLIYSKRIRLTFGFFDTICLKQRGSYNNPRSQVVEVSYFWNYVLTTEGVI